MIKLSEKVKKNLLDLSYNKYLQYYNTSIIIIFTYLIGVGIAFLTKAIDYRHRQQVLLVSVISLVFLLVLVLLLRNFKEHQENIKEEMRKLRI